METESNTDVGDLSRHSVVPGPGPGPRPAAGLPGQVVALRVALVRGLRPKQWLKNLLVFAAPAAGGVLTNRLVLAQAGLAFLVMCAVASATYLMNDVVDAEADRVHPHKLHRPVASGALPPRSAIFVAVLLTVAGLSLGSILGVQFLSIVVTYLVLTLSYSLWLQRLPIVDIALVASFFVLRALAGGAATGVTISPWFLILTSCVALFVVAGKRYSNSLALAQRSEVPEFPPPAGTAATPPPEAMYSVEFLRYVWMLASALAIAAYTLWAFAEPHVHHELAWSELSIVPFALAMLRYAMILDVGSGGAPEDVILRDRALQVFCLMWIVVYGMGVYLHG